MGLESISEPDFDLPDEDDEFADAEDRMRSGSASPDTSLPSTHSKYVEEAEAEDDTEDDPVDPITPGPGRSTFHDMLRAPERIEKQASTSTTDSTDLKFNFPHIAGAAGAITWPTRLDETVTLDATCSSYRTLTVYTGPFAAELSKKYVNFYSIARECIIPCASPALFSIHYPEEMPNALEMVCASATR